MAHEPAPAIEKILTDVDGTLRRRLSKLGLAETDHLILAVAPDGACIIRSNCAPPALRAMASALNEIAEQFEGAQRPN